MRLPAVLSRVRESTVSQHGDNSTLSTSFFLSNFHCSTCTSTIEDALRGVDPRHITWISPNLVTSVLTVEHNDALSIAELESLLDAAGFDVCGTQTSAAYFTDGAFTVASEQGGYGLGSASTQQITPSKTANKATSLRDQWSRVHLQNCEKCKSDFQKGPSCETLFCATDPGSETLKSTGGAEQLPKTPSKAFTREEHNTTPPGAKWKATFVVGGMTCAVCVNAITEDLSKRDWISRVVVNLVSNSATVELYNDDRVTDAIAAIEELGYEATLDSLIDLYPGKVATQRRIVEILLKGTYCERCPTRVAKMLAGFGCQVENVRRSNEKQAILRVSYTPAAPTFTIRRILAAIEANDPALTASIHHAPTLEERSNQILRRYQLQLLYRIVLSGVICIPTFIIGTAYMTLAPNGNIAKQYLTLPWTSGISRAQIALLIMATPVYFLAADVFHIKAIKELKALWRRGSTIPVLQRFYKFGSMNTLMSLGTTIAYLSSIAQLIVAGISREHQTNGPNLYFDSVIFLTFFILIGRLIESLSKARTGDAVGMLGKLLPTTAILVERIGTEKEEDVAFQADLLDFGDVVRIPHGASPPADGVIVHGETIFDESSLTGESKPVKKATGDEIFAGTINKASPALVRITGVVGYSLLDQIINVVREGQTKKAPVQQLADVVTAYFVPIITLIAVLTWVVWMSLGLSGMIPSDWLAASSGGWVVWSLQFAIAVFVVACPCGLALAAPTAIYVGGGLAAKHGILAKGGGEAFEKASKVDCVVFDKTGTLTTGGEPSVTDFEMLRCGDGDDQAARAFLLAALKTVEENSSHPIAKAVVSFCVAETAHSVDVESVEEIPGMGMKAVFAGETPFDLIVGTESLLAESCIQIPAVVINLLQKWKTEAKSIALVATRRNNPSAGDTLPAHQLAAAFAISDPIRSEAPAIIRKLRNSGTAVWLLSGDNRVTAVAVAKQVGIEPENVIAGVLPTQKAEKITYLQSILKARIGSNSEITTRRAVIAMVGDGINDSPALTAADIGIAIGSGSDITISSADFVLLNSDLHSVVVLLELSRMVFRRMKFNFGWALGYNCIAVPMAAGCFYGVVSHGSHVHLAPVWASLAMALSSVSVVTSSLALRSRVPGFGFRASKCE